MNATRSDRRSRLLTAELQLWMQENAEDNHVQQERLRRNLRLARQQELTPRQQEIMQLYYDRELTIPQIAQELHVRPSTVSRTLQRARQRLFKCLRYGL